MKKEFIGFYDPTETEINNAWDKGSFAFDANSLLNLYRYSEATRKDFLASLKTLNTRLFLPHQAALEFHTNRLNVVQNNEDAYSDLKNIYEANFNNNLTPAINRYKKHPSINIEVLKKLQEDFLKKISAELEKQEVKHPANNEILDEVSTLFENCVGKEFSKKELETIYQDGKDRYAQKIPPGYMDEKDKKSLGDRNLYGDLIIWREVIQLAKREKKPLIFVTDDRKDDWWTKEKGKTIRPREELIKEFFDLTGIRILIYNADQFLHFAKEKKLVPQLKEKTIEEVKNVRVSDEKMRIVTNWDDAYKKMGLSDLNLSGLSSGHASMFAEIRALDVLRGVNASMKPINEALNASRQIIDMGSSTVNISPAVDNIIRPFDESPY